MLFRSRYAGLLLEVFIRSRGVISTMEKELGLSYPTVRARIDALMGSLGYEPLKSPAAPKDDTRAADKRKVLELLEQGAISTEEAKARLKEFAKK